MYTKLQKNISAVKGVLTSEDILVFEFSSLSERKFAAVYADELVDKNLLGELVVKPLRDVEKNDDVAALKRLLASPEVKAGKDLKDAVSQISDGNAVLFIDGERDFFIIGLKNPPGRAVAEPPTQVTVKGPREGFTEDIKVNLGLVRKRIKSDKFNVKTIKIGKQSETSVAICYIDEVCQKDLPEKVERAIFAHEIDIVPDSSYVAKFITKKPKSLFKRWATSEKPDIFCAKICEGRVGIIVDGSPIALTVPYMLVEEFQTAEDYYVSSFRASIVRGIRAVAVAVGVLLPAAYICAQLFKIQLIPLKLLLKIASSVSGIPLSPSVEMFLTLFLLEVLIEASIRMPKYVGLAMSVVGALVLGDTAVKAGIISTPAIIIIAFSAICIYTVPDLIETTSTLRLLFLIVAGAIGPYGVVLFIAYLLCYAVTEQSFGVPLVAPYSPLNLHEMKDGLYKANLLSLKNRPSVLGGKNLTRLKVKDDKDS